MSPAHPFIESRVASLRTEIDSDLFAWLSGKKHPNIEYSGSLPIVFWGPFLNEHVASITEAAFVAARDIAEKNGIDPIAASIAASVSAENSVRLVIDKMIDYDRKMRGKGFPKSVPAKDATIEIRRSVDFILKRKAAEIEILRASKKEKGKFRFSLVWLATIATIIGVPFTILGPISCSKDITESTKQPTKTITRPQLPKTKEDDSLSVQFSLPQSQEQKLKTKE